MEIIDAQIHDVHPFTPWSESFTPEQQIEASAELAAACMDAVGVKAAVVNARLPVVEGYLARYPDRFAGLPFLMPQAPREETPEELVAKIKATPGMIGIRLFIGLPLDGSNAERWRRGEHQPFVGAAAHHDLPVFLLMHGYLPELHETLRAHPELTVIVDHLGLFHPPWKEGPALFDDLPEVLELAQFPNVAVKFSGGPHLSQTAYPFEDLWPHLHKIIDAFGVDRLMWGSDFTRCRDHHRYREAVDYLLHTDEVSQSDKEALFSGTIRKWLKWPTP